MPDLNMWLEFHPAPITLHSGQLSHWKVNGEVLFNHLPLREQILHFFVKQVRLWRPPYKILGIPTGGKCWAEEIWKMVQIESEDAPDQIPITFLVDDVITTGSSMDANLVHDRLAVVDRRPPGLALRQPHINAWMTIALEN